MKKSHQHTKGLALFVAAITCLVHGGCWGTSSSTTTGTGAVKTVDKGDFVVFPATKNYTSGDREHPPVTTGDVDSFCISKLEVTQTLYDAVQEGQSAEAIKELFGIGHPVSDVSWEDAALFCNKLSRLMDFAPCYDETTFACDQSKNGFRLPSNAEWELACRGRSKTIFFWGNDKSEGKAYCVGFGQTGTAPVGTKDANQHSLKDINGNVSEWVNDQHPNNADWRIYRGGSYEDSAAAFESTWYDGLPKQEHWKTIGFRVARTIK